LRGSPNHRFGGVVSQVVRILESVSRLRRPMTDRVHVCDESGVPMIESVKSDICQARLTLMPGHFDYLGRGVVGINGEKENRVDVDDLKRF
jgi:hypothetical protein